MLKYKRRNRNCLHLSGNSVLNRLNMLELRTIWTLRGAANAWEESVATKRKPVCNGF